MPPESLTGGWRFWLVWAIAFLGFPISGLVTSLVIGPVSSTVRAAGAGIIAGLILGAVQWIALQNRMPVGPMWVAATAIGFGVGLPLSVAILGSEVADSTLLWRAAVTGLCIGLAQWMILRPILPQSIAWVVVLAIAWVAGWYVTRAIGVNLEPKWTVFGAAGALTFQLITGVALYVLLGMAQTAKP